MIVHSLRLGILVLSTLLHGGHALGHGRGGTANAVCLVEVLQHLLAHVQVGGAHLCLDALGHGNRLSKEICRFSGTVSD